MASGSTRPAPLNAPPNRLLAQPRHTAGIRVVGDRDQAGILARAAENPIPG